MTESTVLSSMNRELHDSCINAKGHKSFIAPSVDGTKSGGMAKERYSITHPISVGERIRRFREAYQWSQTEFATRSGCSAQTVNNYETGLRRPTPEQMFKFRVKVGMTSDYILFADEMSLSEEARGKLATAAANGNRPVKKKPGRRPKKN
jgi:DNA-binding transcriptional regulator YiaG